MALEPLRPDDAFEDSPAFLDPSVFTNDQVLDKMIAYSQPPPFRPIGAKSNAAIDPLLSNIFTGFDHEATLWAYPQYDMRLDNHMSPIQANFNYDTGYGSQESSPDKASPPTGFETAAIPPSNIDNVNSSEILTHEKSKSKKRAKEGGTGAAKPPVRKSRKRAKASHTEEQMQEADDERRNQFLERNRQAASKCRQKKKEWTSNLEERAWELTNQRQMLTAYVTALKNELLVLKCKCLEHSNCGCERIREYLTKSVANLQPASAYLYQSIGEGTGRKSALTANRDDTFSSPSMSVTSPDSQTNSRPDLDGMEMDPDMQMLHDDACLIDWAT